jgi:hypothetical protein
MGQFRTRWFTQVLKDMKMRQKERWWEKNKRLEACHPSNCIKWKWCQKISKLLRSIETTSRCWWMKHILVHQLMVPVNISTSVTFIHNNESIHALTAIHLCQFVRRETTYQSKGTGYWHWLNSIK